MPMFFDRILKDPIERGYSRRLVYTRIMSVCRQLCLSAVFLFVPFVCSAQNIAVSTNVVDWADFLTMNVEAGIPLAKHFSVHAQVRVNPWVWGLKEGEASYDDIVDLEKAGFLKKKTQVGLSVRYWPWYVFSGIWVRAKGQFCSYDRGGKFLGEERRIGDAFGVGLGAGYTLMLSRNWNLDFGAGVWAGMTNESVRVNVVTPKNPEPEWKKFVWLDDIVVAFVYVF